MQGYMGMKSAFIRTPKFNSDSTQNKFLPNQYAYITITWLTIAEGLLAIYFLFGVAIAVHFNNFSIIPMFIMAIIGFSMVFIWSLQERNKTMKRAA
jgi:FtsH-binding integral membrane protein